MALTPDGPNAPDAAANLGTGPDDATQMSSDQPGQRPSALVGASPRDLTAPIVVPNTLWNSTSPAAYNGGRPTAITHLRELEGSDEMLRDTARWGALEVIPTKADLVLDLIRMNSLWPLLSGLACCAIEMMSAATSKNDMDRWGMFPFRASPRQADVLIVAGTLTTKMAGPLIRLWEQMPEPKWCVAMGDCTCSGGRYKRSYSTVEGIDRVMPVDVYVPGCPPRPEGLIFGMMKLQQLVKERRGQWQERSVGPNIPEDV
jgi:NADH-quinone oxidoreductase subunit B